jgi:glycosyltransferase involved in cell wall biosynthesis
VGLQRPILWGYVPQAEALVEPLEASVVIYHCVDDLGAVAGVDAVSVGAAEARFAARADLVLASAPGLVERMRRYSDNVLYVPNVADTARFATALEPGPVDPAVAALPRPRVVFTGAVVESKLDFPLIEELARLRPAWSIALVGPVGPGDPGTDVSALAALPNVHLPGARRYDELPAVLRGADAGIIPYGVNDITRSVFPMKVYEYLAAGLPVVATRLPALADVEGVTLVDGAREMAERIDAALVDDGATARRARSELAAAHSWDARFAELAAAVERL